jgi:hypothetical protein
VSEGPLFPEDARQGTGWRIDWAKIPDNSVVFIDEAWKLFPVRKQGSKVPPHVEFLATHRHRGLDVYLVTQDKGQLDIFARKLIGRHYHVSRKFGREVVTVYQWERVSDPTSDKDLSEALRVRWQYDHTRYGWYHSAFAHTAKRDFPLRMVLYVVGGAAACAVLVYFALHHSGIVGRKAPAVAVAASSSSGAAGWSNAWTAAARAPRLAGVPQSAPYFDVFYAKPRSQPAPVGCMRLDIGHLVKCQCFSSQGSVLEIATDTCVRMMAGGWFDPARQAEDVKAENIAYLNARDGGEGGRSDSEAGSQAAGAAGGGGRPQTSAAPAAAAARGS